VNVRAAGPDDAPEIARIHIASWREMIEIGGQALPEIAFGWSDPRLPGRKTE
jgi:hypothetical protein